MRTGGPGVTDLGGLVRGLSAVADGPRLLAVGWATVDLERTLDDPGGGRPVAILHEPLLGARAIRLDAGGTIVLVLEPSTEGPLAAALARRGEGICALYLAAVGSAGQGWRSSALGLPGRLLPHAPWGPFVIEVAGAG